MPGLTQGQVARMTDAMKDGLKSVYSIAKFRSEEGPQLRM